VTLRPRFTRQAGGLRGYLTAQYPELVARYGTPNARPSVDGKTQAEWILEDPDTGLIVRIYDYKTRGSFKLLGEWHIGGEQPGCVAAVERDWPGRTQAATW